MESENRNEVPLENSPFVNYIVTQSKLQEIYENYPQYKNFTNKQRSRIEGEAYSMTMDRGGNSGTPQGCERNSETGDGILSGIVENRDMANIDGLRMDGRRTETVKIVTHESQRKPDNIYGNNGNRH